jgi:hypothetical protein
LRRCPGHARVARPLGVVDRRQGKTPRTFPLSGRGGAGAASPRPAWSPPHLRQAAYGMGTVGATLYPAPRQASPAPLRSRLHPKGVAGHQGRTKPQGPSRLGPEASSPVAAPGSAAQASASVRTSAKPSRILLHSRGHLGLGVPCTPRHSPGYAYPPLGPGGRPCPGKIDLDTNRGSRQGIV